VQLFLGEVVGIPLPPLGSFLGAKVGAAVQSGKLLRGGEIRPEEEPAAPAAQDVEAVLPPGEVALTGDESPTDVARRRLTHRAKY
jgi:hypothetical protein